MYNAWPALVVHGACKTYPLLRQFSGTLVLAVPQQFDDTSLVGRKTGDFLDDFADEGGSLGESALAAGDTGRRGQDGDFLYTMALVSSGRSSFKVLQSSRRDLSDLGGWAGGCIAGRCFLHGLCSSRRRRRTSRCVLSPSWLTRWVGEKRARIVS